MALIFLGKSKCRLCNQILFEHDEVIGLPASSYTDHELHHHFDNGFHKSCYDDWNRKEEIEDLIKREKREFQFSTFFKDMEQKHGPPSHKLHKTNLVPWILEEYKKGRRTFEDLEVENESFENQQLDGVIFKHCMLYADFRNANLENAEFLNGNVKTSDFRGANLRNARFENQGIEATRFSGCKWDGLIFVNNSCYSATNLGIDDFKQNLVNT